MSPSLWTTSSYLVQNTVKYDVVGENMKIYENS
jgi:hypothetical protein